MTYEGNGELSKALAQRIANIDDIGTVLNVMNAINTLTLCGFLNRTEYNVCSSMLEKTHNYLMTMAHIPGTGI